MGGGEGIPATARVAGGVLDSELKAAVLVAELQGEMMEGGRWPRTCTLREGLEKGSSEWKGVKRIYERTHTSDRGGDGALWTTSHDKGQPHVVV